MEAERPQEVAQEVEEVEEYQSIEKLENLGIGKADVKKAKEAGFHTVESLLMSCNKALTEIKGLSDAKIGKMREAAMKLVDTYTFKSAKEIEAKREREIVHISSGCAAVDEMLKGGVETKAITEIFGEWRTGKTQLCMTMCVTAQINDKNPGMVAYIDTEGGFRPDRLRSIAERFGIMDKSEQDAVLDHVISVRPFNYEHQIEILTYLAAAMSESHFKLVIIDSISALFRADFTGRGELAERQQKVGVLMNKLKKLAEEFNVAIVVTNQVISDPSGGAMFVSDPKKPALGHVMAHASHVRLSARKGKAEQRLLKVVQAPNLAEAEASYAITEGGVTDYKD